MDAGIISIPRALLSGGKLLLIDKVCGKAESSLAPQVTSLGSLPSAQELTTAIASPVGQPGVPAEVWGTEWFQHQRLIP